MEECEHELPKNFYAIDWGENIFECPLCGETVSGVFEE